MIKFENTPSPNHEPRPPDCEIDMLVLHYTGMPTAAEAIARLCDPSAKVSAHYLIEEDGRVHRLVPEEHRAWHAGVAYWRGHTDINDRSIGIELVNPGHDFGYPPFPAPQMAALRHLARGILMRHPIPPRNVVGHSDIAPTRKCDPGERFDWEWLARAGIGIWPRPDDEPDTFHGDLSVGEVQAMLGEIGYRVPRHGQIDDQTAAAITAFQRHWRRHKVDGQLDAGTVRQIEAVISLIGGTVGA